MARRDLEVDERRGVHADLDHVQDEVRPVERLAAVGVGRDRRVGPQLAVDPSRDAGRRVEPLGVDVVQRDMRVGELVEAQQVGQQLAGELDAAGADERDLDH